MQQPSIGRVLHFYLGPDEDPVPAIVTRVWSERVVNVRVFTDDTRTPTHVTSAVIVDEGATNGAGSFCRWPPFVRPKIEGQPVATATPGSGEAAR